MSLEEHDGRELRCRMLGHEVPFGYCRAMNDGLPCRRILDCWHERFDVQTFVEAHFSPEQLARAMAPPPPKMLSILELIEKARRSAEADPAADA